MKSSKFARSVSELGELLAVRVWVAEGTDWVDMVSFEMARGTFNVNGNVDFDSIELGLETPSERPGTTPANPSAWDSLLGSNPDWVWVLKNQNGYRDAVQIAFSRGQERVIVQLLAEGSKLLPLRLESLGPPWTP